MPSGDHTAARLSHRFFCDTMLGRLARWLRLSGYYADYRSEIDDWDMVRLCSHEGLILLTRDTGVMQRRQIARGDMRALLLSSSACAEQLREVTHRLGLVRNWEPLCPECNHDLEAVRPGAVRDLVPAYVQRTQENFRRCMACKRVYWQATHWEEISKKLDESFGREPQGL
jgi:uncharacterized protein with PIN domain